MTISEIMKLVREGLQPLVDEHHITATRADERTRNIGQMLIPLAENPDESSLIDQALRGMWKSTPLTGFTIAHGGGRGKRIRDLMDKRSWRKQ